jgi:hypothetical protein
LNRGTHLKGDIHAIAEMYPLEIAGGCISILRIYVGFGKSHYASVRDGETFDQADPSKLR